jgi:hypothetical protein
LATIRPVFGAIECRRENYFKVQSPKYMMKKSALKQLTQAREQDMAGEFKLWRPRHLKRKRAARLKRKQRN